MGGYSTSQPAENVLILKYLFACIVGAGSSIRAMMHQNEYPDLAMPQESALSSLDRFLAQYARLLGELYAQALCARWGISEKLFAEGLRRSAEKRFGRGDAAPKEVEAYLKSLHLEDLALACACSEGIEAAWEFFMAHFRQDLRGAASAMLRASGIGDDARAADLADSLYAELYGVRSGAGGRRKSLFEYFHGRSKLSTWLRAVLAQKQVDLFRAGSRTVSLDAGEEDTPRPERARETGAAVDPHREMYLGRIDRALRAALANLTSRERMILACYYTDELTLAEIGRLLGEHESTVSRQLERTRRTLREGVTQMLQRDTPASNGRQAEAALDPAQIELAFEYAVEDWPFDLSRALSAAEPGGDSPVE
jgi:RNA polymerase sigma-70 factor